ncbi:MAG: hypothetical protein HGB08_04255 [Candidatus Moranbacteria bacterium]|nr:hypothetical protein [Candidatus Moranbacteria bacterium]
MSRIIDRNTEESLLSLGFNEKETLVYARLLSYGEMSAITLSKLTGLHRQFIYNALSSLESKEMVSRVGIKKSSWRAENPRKLITLAENQEKKAMQASQALMMLMQQKSGQEFSITEGNKAFRARLIDTIKGMSKDTTILMICGEWQRYFDQAGEFVHTQWDRIRVSKNIRFRIIGPESLKTSMDIAVAKRGLIEYRTMKGLEKNLVNTVIYNDTIDFEIYGDPHLTFNIKNNDVSESQRYFFEAMWGNTK